MAETNSYRYIAFNTITGHSCAAASTAEQATALGASILSGGDFVEVLDCGTNGLKIWTGGTRPSNPIALHRARILHCTVYRGAGYGNPLPLTAAAAITKAEG